MTHSDLNEFLYRTGLAERGTEPVWVPLGGGVSSDIWRVELPAGSICVKRAVAKLRVASDWRAPVERNEYEWEWFKFVHGNFPTIVPRPIARDAGMNMLALEYLDPGRFRLWKTELLEGRTDDNFAGEVGSALARIHSAAARDGRVPATFATDKLFFALRIEPYLLATARKHPAHASHIEQIAERTLETKKTLVHGDVSPKNILVGETGGPVFLDAETAWFGDPAFDLAFCLNHLLLKSIHRPNFAGGYMMSFCRLTGEYLKLVDWEASVELDRRAADLLPILTLARVDGKSPVEYIIREADKQMVRDRAARIIESRPGGLEAVASLWTSMAAPSGNA